jgi:amino acid transporter
MASSPRSLGLFSLVFLNISAIISLRHLPAMAGYGLWSIGFYLAAALFFLAPVALICAELASTWPQRGGLYNWIYLSCGSRTAFFSVWWSWMAAIVTILLNLTFFSSTLSYAFFPGSESNISFYLSSTIPALWALTFLNIFGIRFSSMLSSVSLIAGTVIPVIGLVILSIIGCFLGQSDLSKLNFSQYQSTFYSFQSFFFFSNVVVGYAGIELAAFHAADAKDPQKDYSRAIVLSAAAILALYIIGTLALIVVLPYGEIDRIGGIVQFFHVFFDSSSFDHIAKIVSVILAFGTLGATNTWLISPAKGIFAAMEHYEFPQWMTQKNEHDVPVHLLVVQALVCSIMLIFMTMMHSISNCFILLAALTTQFSVLIYILMAVAIYILRRTHTQTIRPFRISNHLFHTVVYTTIVVSVFVLISTLIPVEQFTHQELLNYELVFFVGWVVLGLPPLFFSKVAVVAQQ